MKLLFSHFAISGRSGAASVVIPGPAPSSGFDRAPEFSIQVGFYIVPIGTQAGLSSHLSAEIPGKSQVVHVNFIWEYEVKGSDHKQKVDWPAPGEIRSAITSMLANMLAHSETDLHR